MRSTKLILAVILCAAMAAPGIALAGSNPGPVKFSVMTRVESHSKVANSQGVFSGETYGYFSMSAFRELEKNTFGNIFYITKYSFDEEDIATHIGGVNIIHNFNPNHTGIIGYSYSNNPEIGGTIVNEREDRDRFSISHQWKLNPKDKHAPLYSLTSSYSTVTDFNEQQSLSEKVELKFPSIGQKVDGAMGYTYSYSLRNSDQLTNQINARLTYKYSKTTSVALEGLFIDNVYENNQGDDSIVRLSLNRNVF